MSPTKIELRNGESYQLADEFDSLLRLIQQALSSPPHPSPFIIVTRSYGARVAIRLDLILTFEDETPDEQLTQEMPAPQPTSEPYYNAPPRPRNPPVPRRYIK